MADDIKLSTESTQQDYSEPIESPDQSLEMSAENDFVPPTELEEDLLEDALPAVLNEMLEEIDDGLPKELSEDSPIDIPLEAPGKVESFGDYSQESPEELPKDISDENGLPDDLATLRKDAVAKAWEKEAELVRQGRGTRDWTVAQQQELLTEGKVSGFEGQHMLSAKAHPEYAGDSNNIQFLTYEEHFYGAHKGNFRNQTEGRFNPETGEIHPFAEGEAPEIEDFPLTDTIDAEQADSLGSLDRSFGYGRHRDIADSRELHKGEKSKGSILKNK